MMKLVKNNESLTLFGQIIIALFFCILTLTSAGWLMHIPITVWHLPLAFACSLLIVWALNNRNGRVWKIGLWTTLIIVLCLVVSGAIFDCSFDGQAYHQSTAAAMARSWNPIYNHHNNAIPLNDQLIIDHYLRGTETLQAVFYRATGWIESAKAVNLLFALAGFALILPALRSRFAQTISDRKILFISILLVMCPVTITQVLTFYIDFVMYGLLLCAVALLITKQSDSQRTTPLIFIAMLTAIAITIKLNTFFFFGVLVIIYLCWTLYQKQYKQFKQCLITNAAAALLGVFLLAYNPFITNAFDHRHPFYPLMVSSQTDDVAWDIMTGNTPLDLRNGNRVQNVLLSNFSVVNNVIDHPIRQGIASRGGEMLLFSPDVRVGGFGLFFGISVLMASLLYFSSRLESKTDRRAFATIIIAIVGGVFVFAEGWWARYVPFFWALPLTMTLYWELSTHKRKWQRLLAKLIYTLIVFNAISGFAMLSTSLKFTKKNIDQLNQCAQYAPFELWVGPNVSIPEKLELLGIEHTTLHSFPDTAGKTIYFVGDDLDGGGSFFILNKR